MYPSDGRGATAGSSAARTWIRDPLAITAEDADRGVVVQDGRIVELVPSGAQPQAPVDETFDAGQHVVVPGLVNSHHHMFQTLTRAHPAGLNKPLFEWLDAMFPVWVAHLGPDSFRMATRLAMTELLLSGCTTTADHHYLYPPGMGDAVDIQAEEAARVGIRMTVARGAITLPSSATGGAASRPLEDDDAVLADGERAISRYHDASEGSMLQVVLAPGAPFLASPRLMVETAALAERLDVRLHTHLAESPTENDYCRENFSCRPVEYLADLGWISDRVWLPHGIHFDDAEIAFLGRAGVGVSHCPTSNMVLASGLCRTRELEAAGVPVGLGVDGSASNDNSNMIESVRHALMINRLTYDATVTHRDALRWATQGSAACLGRTDIGHLSVGAQADLALYTLRDLRFSGAGDPLAALILCGAHTADRVMVKGDWRVVDAYPVGVDVEKLRWEHGRAARQFLEAL